MRIKIGNFEYSEVWDGVFYKKLSDYPRITDWEIRNIFEFIDYESKYGREYPIECEDGSVLSILKEKLTEREKYLSVRRPALITECTACPERKGCVIDYVCHTTSVENAKKIFECGKR